MKKILLLILLISSVQVFSQGIYYVKPGGDDANYGNSWANAFATIQRALSVISTGEIWVAAGTYYPDEGGGKTNNDRLAYFSMRSGVALYGGFFGNETALSQRNWTMHETILSGDINKDGGLPNNSIHVVFSKSDDNTAILDGFTITAGNADDGSYVEGGGMRCDDSSPFIRNCTFTGNVADYGGAMYNNNSHPILLNCRFQGNTGFGDGGAMYNHDSSPTIVNCIFAKNHSTEGSALCNVASSPDIIHCTFYANGVIHLSDYTHAIYNYGVNSTIEIYNSILWDNGEGEIYNYMGGDCIINYSIVRGGYSGTGNLNKDPMFISDNNLHLNGCSPAINTASSEHSLSTDMDGNPRPALGGYDMGAYEFQPGGFTVLYVKSNATGSNNGSSWGNAFTKLQDALAKAPSCNNATQIWVAAGTYYPDEGAGMVFNDRYASFALKNNIAIYGGFNGTETVLTGRDWKVNPTILSGDIDHGYGNTNNSYHVVTATSVNSSAVLDGFTITGGNGGAYNGGGMYITSATPTISHCSFENNTADVGAGLYIKAASPSISYSRIANNSARVAAGMYVQSTSVSPSNATPLLNGVSFMSNTATSEAGGIYNFWSGGTIENCIFWANNAPKGAAMVNDNTYNLVLVNNSFALNTSTGSGGTIYNWNSYTSQPTITNSIFWANTGLQIAQDDATVSYSIVPGGYSGSNIWNFDPLFVNLATGNLKLQQNSPSINIGSNAAVSGIARDASELSRIYNNIVDLGAYEYTPAGGAEGGVTEPLSLNCGGDITVNIEPGTCGYNLESYGYWLKGGVKPITMTFSTPLNTILPVGDHLITINATDSTGDSQTCSYTISVVDTIPPVVYCGDGSTLLRSPGNNCKYIINGNELDVQATDNCTIPLAFYYHMDGATTNEIQGFNSLDGVALNKGQTTIHYFVLDVAGNVSTCSRVVNVADNTAPQILDLTVDKPVLYPPNHQMQDINVRYYAMDNCPGVVTSLTVSSNETSSINGAGNTPTDWLIVDNHHLKLRAERSGTGSDRIYTISVIAIDAAGHTSSATTRATVPHDNKSPVIVRARIADAKTIAGLQVTAAPNPFTNGFILTIQSPYSTPVNIRVLDAAGRLIESRTSLVANEVQYLGQTYRPGVFHVQAIQGDQMQTLKLVKQ